MGKGTRSTVRAPGLPRGRPPKPRAPVADPLAAQAEAARKALLDPTLLARITAAECVQSLRAFVGHAWPQLERVPLAGLGGGYVDVICDHLEAVTSGKLRNIVINLINRSAKSQIASVLYPVWLWLVDPGHRLLTASWEHGLSLRDSWRARQLMATPWYQGLLRDAGRTWTFVGDQNEKGFYANTSGGERTATHVGSGTGRGGDTLIGDDILGIDQSRSDVETLSASEWVLDTFLGRRNDPKRSRVVIVGHRLRQDDPYGELLKREALGFEAVVLPLEYDPATKVHATSIGWVDKRTTFGESLCEARWGPVEISQAKAQYEDLYEAIANQRPTKRGGKPIKAEWIKRWVHLPPKFDRIVETWDTSFKGSDPTRKGAKRSRTAGQKWGVLGAHAYLLDARCEQMDFNEQSDAIRAMRARPPFSRKTWIEDEANGAALIASLGLDLPGVLGSIPRGSKYLRLVAVSRFFRAGNVWLPPDELAPWVPGLVQRILDFPSIDFDDEIDALSQFLKEEFLLEDEPIPGDDVAKLNASCSW